MKKTAFPTLFLLLVLLSPAQTWAETGLPPTKDEAQQTGQVTQDRAEMAAKERAPRPIAARTQRVNLLVAGNTEGHFADVDCRSEEILEPHFARQVSYFHTLDTIADAGHLPRPITLHSGDALFPGTLARFLLEDEEGPQKIAQLLSRLSLSVMAMGNQEFALDRGSFIELIEAAQQEGVQIQAQNLRCEGFGPAEALCHAINQPLPGQKSTLPYRIIERGGVRFAITSILAPGLIASLDGPQKEGLRILDPLQALPETLKSMRDEADLTIVQLHTLSSNRYQTAYELAQKVEGMDLLIASQFLDPENGDAPLEEGPMAVLRAQNTETPIVTGNSGAHALINLELTVVSNPNDSSYRLQDLKARRISTKNFPPHNETATLLQEKAEYLCQDWGQPTGNHAKLPGPFTFEEMQLFILNIMRFATNSEVALMNSGAFRNEEHFPIDEALTAADIYTILPFENQLMTASIKGSSLQKLAPKLTTTLRAAGLTKKGDKTLINGRPIAPDRLYKIAINDYLARGGDKIFAADELTAIEPYQSPHREGQIPLDELIIHFVETDLHIRKGAEREYISAKDNFPDLHRKGLWTFLGSLNASYNQVTVQNPAHNGSAGYDHSQLKVDSADQINLEGRLSAQADSRDHRWNNDLNLQYATTRQDGAEEFEETKDLIRFRSSYRNQRLRALQGGHWFLPDPLIEGQLETEFSRPDSRAWHRLDLRAILGLSFQLFTPLDLRLGTNVRRDINEPGGRRTWGINAGFTLRRVDLAKLLGRPVQFESEAEYFYNDIAGDNIHELRSTNRLFFAVFDQFFFTASFNLFFFKNDQVGLPGTNRELMLGLNYQWDAALQRF